MNVDEQRHFKISRDPKNPRDDRAGLDEYPWYVQETTFGDDRDDYGRMETHGAAVDLMKSMVRA